MRSFLTITGVCAALAFAGCGGGDDNDSSSGSSGSTGTQQSSASGGGASSSGGSMTVNMQNIQFDPKTLKAKVGQTIKWVNQDTVDHNVTADSGEDFKSKDFGQGGSYSYKLDKAGTIKYECTLHPGMVGTVTVTK
jgi:plastocyanin